MLPQMIVYVRKFEDNTVMSIHTIKYGKRLKVY